MQNIDWKENQEDFHFCCVIHSQVTMQNRIPIKMDQTPYKKSIRTELGTGEENDLEKNSFFM